MIFPDPRQNELDESGKPVVCPKCASERLRVDGLNLPMGFDTVTYECGSHIAGDGILIFPNSRTCDLIMSLREQSHDALIERDQALVDLAVIADQCEQMQEIVDASVRFHEWQESDAPADQGTAVPFMRFNRVLSRFIEQRPDLPR